MIHHKTRDLPSIFAAYEKTRRSNIDHAYNEAVQRWETVKDSGWVMYQMKKLLTPWFLWWTAKSREEEFSQDWSEVDIQV